VDGQRQITFARASCRLLASSKDPSRDSLFLLLGLVLQKVASLSDSAWIDCLRPLFNMLNNSVLVQQERGADGEAPGGVQDAVLHADLSLEVAEQREGYAEVFGKAFVAGRGIDADANDLRVVSFVMCDISLIRP